METTTKIYINLFRTSTPVSNPVIPAGELAPRFLPAELCIAIRTVTAATAPGPDHDPRLVENPPKILLKKSDRDDLRNSHPNNSEKYQVWREYRLPLALTV
ncbi:unnamed protein product [Strongylus vulgaris]|uniref:Uncharacterized protein n=1 Tax=Strongylus vulgaris TaxID=40348 RepID=A0A3P7ISN4_STRVU|nr:unnamed protein product [Strongylus vulgaris]